MRVLLVSATVLFTALVIGRLWLGGGIAVAFLGGAYCCDRGWLDRRSS